jgi:hypothetical protein
MTEYVDQPPAEHSTRDPWPDGFAVPDVVSKLKATAEASGWEARVGYSRAYEKRGRGNVGGEGNARWVRRHFVAVQVRRTMAERMIHRAIYGADVGMESLEWTVASVQVDGMPSGILAFRRLIKGSA